MNVFKDPITDSGKKSKKGRLTLEVEDGKHVTHEEGTGNTNQVCCIVSVCCFLTNGGWEVQNGCTLQHTNAQNINTTAHGCNKSNRRPHYWLEIQMALESEVENNVFYWSDGFCHSWKKEEIHSVLLCTNPVHNVYVCSLFCVKHFTAQILAFHAFIV